MPLVLRWRRWIRSGGGHESDSRSIILFRVSPLRSHRSKDLGVRSGSIRSCLEAAAGMSLFSNILSTSSSCPSCSGFWSPPSTPWFPAFGGCSLHASGFQRFLPSPTHPPSFAPIGPHLLTRLWRFVPPLTPFPRGPRLCGSRNRGFPAGSAQFPC